VVTTARTLGVAAVAGFALGVMTQIGQSILPDPLRPVANSISPWLAVAFGVGSIARRQAPAGLAAFVSLAFALVGYYAMVWIRFGYGASNSALVLWGLAAVAGGLVFGPAGWFWRNGRGWWSAVPIGLLAAAFVADAVYIYSIVQPEEKPAAVLFVLVGALVPALLGRTTRERADGYIAVLPALALAALGYLALTNLMVSGPV
jgi:hypothetical protein